MENLRIGETGVSSLPGVLLLVGLTMTMLLAMAVMTAVFASKTPESGLQANIEVQEVKGGLLNDTLQVNFSENWIALYHKLGYPLKIARTKIQIKGYGETQNSAFGQEASSVGGNILVEYTNLEYAGKLEAKPGHYNYPYSQEYHGYAYHNPDLSDGLWSPGEKLILNGQDSKSSGESSSVKVYIDGNKKTDNNWRFSKGEQITITIMDAYTDTIISTAQITVQPAKQ